jgi:hypothetical protein
MTGPIPDGIRGRRRPQVGDRLPYRLSAALAIVATLGAVLSFSFWGLFDRDVPVLVGNLRGTAVSVGVIAIPILVASMILTAKGSLGARFGWLACLGYLTYNAVLFCFLPGFNALFLLFTSMLGLAFWALVTLVPTFDHQAVVRSATHVPVRSLAIYLWVSALVFAVLWLADVVPASIDNRIPDTLTELGLTVNAIWVLDFAFSFPFMVIGGIWMWQRRAWGYIIGGSMVIMLTMETAGVAIDQVYGNIHDAEAPLAQVFVLAVTTIAGIVASTAFLVGLRSASVDRDEPRPVPTRFEPAQLP